jgi:hypothetical protein
VFVLSETFEPFEGICFENRSILLYYVFIILVL